jgi:IPT/TIG domain/Cysteine-rich secretory protein family
VPVLRGYYLPPAYCKIGRSHSVVLHVTATAWQVFDTLGSASLRSGAIRRLAVSALGVFAIGLLSAAPATPSPVNLKPNLVASGPWLTRFNAWRASTGTSTLTENATWSAGDYNHALYMVQTGQVTHSESTAYPQYTASGATESGYSNIFVSSTTATTDVQSIDWWMGAPFHAMAMMDPRLTTTGFGSYRNSAYTWQMGAAVDVGQGMTAPGQYPVYFPGNGSTEPLTAYSGNEFPDPTQTGGCPGYGGLPLFIEVGANVSTSASSHALTQNGALLDSCVLDSSNALFTSYLKWRGGVIIMPRAALQSGLTYMVAVTVNAIPYTWSFTVGPSLTASLQTVTGVSPNAGPAAGGTGVTITGKGFSNTTSAVKFGATPAASFSVVNDTTITAVTPAHTVSTVDVTVTTAGGTTLVTPLDQFTFTGLTSYFQWFDMASPGMFNDNIHLLNTSAAPANITVTLPGTSAINVSLPAGAATHVSFGAGHVGGPVVVNSDQQILASQRVQYYQTFNEVWAESAAQAAVTSYINWYDKASAGMYNDNIHLLNPGTSSATVTVSLPGATSQIATVAAGAETYVTFPAGTIGGPVKVSATSPVLASQRVQYYSSFNEVWAEIAGQAATTSYVNWYDSASAGMLDDHIHVVNSGSTGATVTVSIPGATSQVVAVGAGAEAYVAFPAGTIGGPVTVSSTQPVLASQRVQYYSTFNEVLAAGSAQAGTTSHVTWYDKASPGMVNDNIHLLNPGGTSATVTVSLPGVTSQVVTVGPGAEAYVAFPAGTIGGPVTVTSTQPVVASQRVQYYSSFNEIWAA